MNGIDIRKARERQRWTVEQLAERLGVSKATVSRYERDQQTVSHEMTMKLAEVLELSIEQPFDVRLAKLRSDSEGKLKLATDIIEDGEALLLSTDEHSLEYGEIQKIIGENCVKSGLYSKALTHFHKAMNVFVENGYQQRFAKCMVELANAHYALGKYHSAIEYCQFAENELVKMQIPDYTICRMYTIAALSCCQLNDFNMSIQYAELAEHYDDYVHVSEQTLYLASRKYARASCLLDSEQFSDATDAYQEAYHLYQQIGSAYSCLAMKNSIALTWTRAGHIERARTLIDEISMQLMNNDGFRSLEQHVLRVKMELEFIVRNDGESRRIASIMLEQREEISHRNYVDANRFLARLEFLHGNRESALKQFSTIAKDFAKQPGFEFYYKELFSEFMTAFSEPEEYLVFLENKRKTPTLSD